MGRSRILIPDKNESSSTLVIWKMRSFVFRLFDSGNVYLNGILLSSRGAAFHFLPKPAPVARFGGDRIYPVGSIIAIIHIIR